jgi:Tol biopolymer transport system component
MVCRRALLVAAIVLGACRDGVEPFRPEPFDLPEGDVVQLTFNAGEDNNPAWSSGGDTVYYAATGFPGVPGDSGVLTRIAVTGGEAARVFPELQDETTPRWFAAPALAPDGERLAFFELADVAPPTPPADDEPCAVAEPLLDSAVLRVRSLVQRTAPESRLAIDLAGRDPDQKAGLEGPYELTLFPFQRVFSSTGLVPLRPSWSPDGSRVVFSDGLRLLLWTPGPAAATPIPNTDDGVSPAWSPDGQLIAFARLERGASTTASCNVRVGRTVQEQVRTGFSPHEPVVALVRPDGTGLVQLGAGEDPAWSPDGQLLYFVRQGRLFRASRDGSAPAAVAQTDLARNPAVSPDGERIVFARPRPGSGLHDLWVLRLQ